MSAVCQAWGGGAGNRNNSAALPCPRVPPSVFSGPQANTCCGLGSPAQEGRMRLLGWGPGGRKGPAVGAASGGCWGRTLSRCRGSRQSWARGAVVTLQGLRHRGRPPDGELRATSGGSSRYSEPRWDVGVISGAQRWAGFGSRLRPTLAGPLSYYFPTAAGGEGSVHAFLIVLAVPGGFLTPRGAERGLEILSALSMTLAATSPFWAVVPPVCGSIWIASMRR